MPKHRAEHAVQSLHLAIAGGVGTGKSTALHAMSGGNSVFVPGDSAKGTTKKFVPASFDFGNIAVAIHDVPGVGDWHVKPAMLLDMYETHLKDVDVGGLLLFFSVMNPKFDLTPQLILKLMDLAFPDQGAEKWDSVIIVGTHKDVAGPERCAKFKSSGEGSIREMIGEIVEGAKVKHMCCISPNDMSELEASIQALSNSKGIGQYQTPDPDKFAASAAKCLGVVQAPPQCPSGHVLQHRVLGGDRCHVCDLCDCPITPPERLYRCQMCDFDVCQRCHAFVFPASSQPFVLEAFVCPKGHDLQHQVRSDHRCNICDGCGYQINPPEHFYRCQMCDFDRCQRCYGDPEALIDEMRVRAEQAEDREEQIQEEWRRLILDMQRRPPRVVHRRRSGCSIM